MSTHERWLEELWDEEDRLAAAAEELEATEERKAAERKATEERKAAERKATEERKAAERKAAESSLSCGCVDDMTPNCTLPFYHFLPSRPNRKPAAMT